MRKIEYFIPIFTFFIKKTAKFQEKKIEFFWPYFYCTFSLVTTLLLFRFCYFCNGQGTMVIVGQCSKTIVWFQYIIGFLEI